MFRGLNNSPIESPGGSTLNDATQCRISLRKKIRLATWNVRGLLQTEKIHIVENETKIYGLSTRTTRSLLGLFKIHWKGTGHFTTKNGATIYFSGYTDASCNGVAFLVPAISKAVLGYNQINDRIMTIKIMSTPCNVYIVQGYAFIRERNR